MDKNPSKVKVSKSIHFLGRNHLSEIPTKKIYKIIKILMFLLI